MWQQAARSVAGMTPDLGAASWPATTPLQAVVDGLRTALVGRPVRVPVGAERLAFTLSVLEARADPMAAATGQLDDVRVEAEQVTWGSYRFASVSAQLRNVHTRMRVRPLLVSAPVDVRVVVEADHASALLGSMVPAVRMEVTDDALLRVRWTRRPDLGWVAVRPAVEQGRLVVRPTGLGRGGRAWGTGRQLPALRPRLDLPETMRLTQVAVRPAAVELAVRVDEWRLDYLEVASLARRR
jgi:hypothetical protein